MTQTDLSPAELSLLCLMVEVGVPLRLGQRYSIYFLGQQGIRMLAQTRELVPSLLLGEFIEKAAFAGAPPGCLDYVLTEKGREAAEGEDDVG